MTQNNKTVYKKKTARLDWLNTYQNPSAKRETSGAEGAPSSQRGKEVGYRIRSFVWAQAPGQCHARLVAEERNIAFFVTTVTCVKSADSGTTGIVGVNAFVPGIRITRG